MKKVLFILIMLKVATSGAQIHSQNFNPHSYPMFFPMIDGTLRQVSNEMIQVGGTLQSDRTIKATNKQSSYKKLIYLVSDSTKREYPAHTGLDIYKAVIHFTKFNLEKELSCSDYSLWYKSETFLPDIINNFDHSRVGFKRVGKDLKWIKKDITRRDWREVDIIKIKNGSQKGFIYNIKRV